MQEDLEKIGQLSDAIHLLEAYEMPVGGHQIERIIKEVAALQDYVAATLRPNDGAYFAKLLDNVRLYLAAYVPYSESSDLRYLKQRQKIVRTLRSIRTQLQNAHWS